MKTGERLAQKVSDLNVTLWGFVFSTVHLKDLVQAISDYGLSVTPPVKFSFFSSFCVQNACARSTRTRSTRARRARAGFLKISKLHASTRAMRARAEKPACCDCTRVAEHWVKSITKLMKEEHFNQLTGRQKFDVQVSS